MNGMIILSLRERFILLLRACRRGSAVSPSGFPSSAARLLVLPRVQLRRLILATDVLAFMARTLPTSACCMRGPMQ
jgi:hypothetical protein